MTPFLMIPYPLMKSKASRGNNEFKQRYLIALLVHASGLTTGHQWRDLTINAMATMTGLCRQTVSKHWNYIVKNWVEYSLPIIEKSYPGIDTVALTTFMDRIYASGQSRIPCVKGLNSDVLKVLTQRERQKSKTSDVSTDDSSPSPIGIREESTDSTDKGETERPEPSEVSTRRDDVPLRREGGSDDRSDRPTDDWVEFLKEIEEDEL